MRILYTIIFAFVLVFANTKLIAQAPPGCTNTCNTTSGTATFLPTQECAGAIALCTLSYTYPTGAVCGPGRIPCEIPGSTCLSSGERHTTWYVFTVRQAGTLQFKITPLDVVGTGNGAMDYDWAVFKLPSGALNTQTVCTQLQNSGNTWLFNCNYSGQSGVTGMYDTTNTNAGPSQGAGGSRFNRPLPVAVGETFVLAVDNFTGGGLIGYTITFPAPGTQGAADITPEPDPPYFDQVTRQPNCGDTSFAFSFTKPVICTDITTNTFTIKRRQKATQEIEPRNFTITSFLPVSGACVGESQFYNVRFTPIILDTTYEYMLILQDTIRDICGNFLVEDTALFSINPFVALRADPDTSICSNGRIQLQAVVDPSQNIPATDLTFTWKKLRQNGDFTEVGTDPSDIFEYITTNQSTIEVSNRRIAPLIDSVTYRVIARAVSGCIDSSLITYKLLPFLSAQVPIERDTVVCAGRSVRLRARVNRLVPATGALFTYTWDAVRDSAGSTYFYPIVFRPNGTSDSLNRLAINGDSVLVRVPQKLGFGSYVNRFRVIGVNTNGCADTAFVSFKVNLNPDVKLSPSTQVCYGDPIAFGVQSPLDTSKYSYVWRRQDGNAVFTLDGSTFRTDVGAIVITVADSNYNKFYRDSLTVTVTDKQTGCNWTPIEKIGIATSQNMKAVMKIDTISPFGNAWPVTVRLANLSTTSPGILTPSDSVFFRYDFGDGSPVIIKRKMNDTLTHTYTRPGETRRNTYRIKLRIYDSLSAALDYGRCSDSVFFDIELIAPVDPNVITPNGDGLNDRLEFVGKSPAASLTVYNRYGRQVFSKDNYDNSFTGEGLPAGTYYYTILDPLAENKRTNGWFEIIK